MVDGCQRTLRLFRKETADNWLKEGVEVGGEKFTLSQHAANKWAKDGVRKDIMPQDVVGALSNPPIQGANGALIYVNPVSGTWVAVNPLTKEIIQIAPSSFSLPGVK